MSHHPIDLSSAGGTFQISARFQNILYALGAVGIGSLVGLFLMDHDRFWAAFLHNHFYFLSLAVGGLFFAALQWMTGAMWSAPVRRLAESFTAYLPVGVVTLVVVFFGIHHIYHWSHTEDVAKDMVLSAKAPYLNPIFFIVRNVLILAIWMFFAKKMLSNSFAQDNDKGNNSYTQRNRSLAPAFLLVFALSYTIFSFDKLMSLDPHGFSTIFGVYCFAGLFYSTMALIAIMAIYFRRQGLLKDVVTNDVLHDVGKFMFAFMIFWAYIAFSQFMLIWYANLPEETGYYVNRFKGGWMYVSAFLLIGKFFVPFILMQPRWVKRSEKHLLFFAIYFLIAQWIDVLWMVQPQFFPEGPRVGVLEIGAFVGFWAVFATMMFRFLAKHNVLAIGDPRLEEAVNHHHQ